MTSVGKRPGFSPHAVLVTGGAGFIGSGFVRYLLANDSSVRVVTLDKLTYAGSEENLADLPGADRHIFVRGDICDGKLVTRLLIEHGIDAIVHFAAESHVDNSISGPAPFVETNINGTFKLLEAARAMWLEQNGWGASRCRFHHVSTDEVYGSLGPDDPPFTETSRYRPNSPYSASKAASDHLVRSYHHTFGLPLTISNCSNNYGPRQHLEKFIPMVVRSALDGRRIPVYGDGTNIRDWLYVEDHCRGVDLVLRQGRVGEVYNLGGGDEWTNIDIARKICVILDEHRPQAAPHADLISFVSDRPGHDWRYAIDFSKARSELGWEPAESLETGLRNTVDWYLARIG